MVHLCLDFEGVLIPEIWQCLAKEVNSDELMLTTQDLKDYDELMSLRMKVVNEKNIVMNKDEASNNVKFFGKDGVFELVKV